ncbi:MAG TPA: hypothetical protein VK040_04395 [Balneolaceae bacterium]|nr:hypothetical protein [Balneolaceae bacterium]
MSQLSIIEIAARFESRLVQQNIHIESKDLERPWGGFFLIQGDSLSSFIKNYFQNLDGLNPAELELPMSPKLLFVAPKARLSWQYHHRRSEVWSVIQGPVGICQSPTDQLTPVEVHETGSQITLPREIRHRLTGLDHWGVVAEIWLHTDPLHPSDEEDIVRLQDDYGRDRTD